ncbi:MAG: phosphoglycerate mutase, partial [Actinomycetota bacterium]|nr:phosphoglycerate mutase [Actinomycetota bacterium]
MADFKVAVLVPDGASDIPCEELDMRTPLEVARTPNMDKIARQGCVGLARTIPEGMTAGSDVANLSLLGYDPRLYYRGRGSIEAASMGVRVPDGWSAFRFNLVSTDGERMLDYSAGHIDDRDASNFVDVLKREITEKEIKFFQGKSYRHIMLLKGDFSGVKCIPPHDITGRLLKEQLPRGNNSEVLTRVMERSREIFSKFEANRARKERGLPPVDMIWIWGQGTKMELEPF